MNEPIREETLKGYTIKLFYDEYPDSPREWDNLGTMYCRHSRYSLGDKDISIDTSDCNNWEDEAKQIEKEFGKLEVILPLYLYDHSGISMSTGSFHDRWDSGQVGFIFVTKEKVRKEYLKKRISPKLHKAVEEYLVGEVETYDTYLRGEVIGYKITDPKGERLNSCYGFYDEDDALGEAKEAVMWDIQRVYKKRFAKLKTLIKHSVPLTIRGSILDKVV